MGGTLSTMKKSRWYHRDSFSDLKRGNTELFDRGMELVLQLETIEKHEIGGITFWRFALAIATKCQFV